MQLTDLEQRSRALAPDAVEHRACPPSYKSVTSGPSESARWSAGRRPELSVSGIVIRLRSSENLERRRKVVPGGHAPERDDAKRGGRVRRRRLRRKVRDAHEM